MPTPSERKALAFLAFVILLGGTVRVLRAGAPPDPTAAGEQALARQAAAAESAGQRKKPKKGTSGVKLSSRRRKSGVDTVAGVVGVPFSDVRPDRSDRWVNGFPPPSPRVDVGNRSGPGQAGTGSGTEGSRIDLDVATAAEIDRLPRIGPAMAGRLVANRDSFGPFRSLEGLRRVKGMGPATLQRLAPRVTFSGRAASLDAGSRPR